MSVPQPHDPAGNASWPCASCPVRGFNICQPLAEPELAALRALGHRLQWRKGEILCHAGAEQGAFFKITRGIVAVSRRLRDGRRQIMAFRARGDIVGFLDQDGHYAFESEALTDVEACSFDRRRFAEMSRAQLRLAAAIETALANALKQIGHDMTVVGQLTSLERVASFLTGLYDLYGERQLPRRPLRLHMSRREIADYLGLSLETVSRAFSELRDRRVVVVIEHGVVIVDHGRLAAIADPDRA